MKPSRAQGVFIARFEDAYFGVAGRSLDTLAEGNDRVPGVPRGTYRGWRLQRSSPTIWDLERLCALSGERQTLVIDPRSDDKGDHDMHWYDKANRLVGKLANMTPETRAIAIARFSDAIDKTLAEEAQNPSEPVADKSGTARR